MAGAGTRSARRPVVSETLPLMAIILRMLAQVQLPTSELPATCRPNPSFIRVPRDPTEAPGPMSKRKSFSIAIEADNSPSSGSDGHIPVFTAVR